MYGVEPGIYRDEDDSVFDLKTASEYDYLAPDAEEFNPNAEYDGAILLEEDDEEEQEDGGLTGISKPIEGIFERLIFRKVIKIVSIISPNILKLDFRLIGKSRI